MEPIKAHHPLLREIVQGDNRSRTKQTISFSILDEGFPTGFPLLSGPFSNNIFLIFVFLGHAFLCGVRELTFMHT